LGELEGEKRQGNGGFEFYVLELVFYIRKERNKNNTEKLNLI
jgi:hypothetical protein